MLAAELPVHPRTGLTAAGVLPSGRIVWPVLGAAEGDQDGSGGNGDTGTGADAGTGAPGDQDGAGDGDGQDGGGQDGDGLGDAGKTALDKERKSRREAEKARKAAERELAALKAQQAASTQQDDAQQAAEQVRREAEAAANKRANDRILAADIRAEAAGKLADPADALRYLDLADFEVADDGSTDREAITEAISDLIQNKPYLAAKAQRFQGTGDGGAAGREPANGPKQATETEYQAMTDEQRVKAFEEGRLATVLGGG